MKPDPEMEGMEESRGSAGDQVPGKQSEPAEVQDAQSSEQPKEEVMEEHVVSAVEPEPEPDTYVEPEPVSRFSREEKGKGKAVDERRLSESPVEASHAKLSLAPVVTVEQNTAILDKGTAVQAANETKPKEDNERPSRSYLRSPTAWASVGEMKEDVSPASTCDQPLLRLGLVVVVAHLAQLYTLSKDTGRDARNGKDFIFLLLSWADISPRRPLRRLSRPTETPPTDHCPQSLDLYLTANPRAAVTQTHGSSCAKCPRPR